MVRLGELQSYAAGGSCSRVYLTSVRTYATVTLSINPDVAYYISRIKRSILWH